MGSLRLSIWARLALCLLLASAFAYVGTAGSPPTVTAGNPRHTPFTAIAERVKGAVINIHSERTVQAPSLDSFHSSTSNRINGMGTGIVLDPRGYIITNHHVVEDVSLIRAKTVDGASYNARVVARDPENDLALLRIEVRSPLPTISLGTASDLMVAEPVMAIGNAYGYEHTHTLGIVSHIKRDVALNKDMSYRNLIQVDTPINPGNSGGPLLNVFGEVVGVNVAIRAGAQNIGFAIPVDTMIRVAAEMFAGLRRRAGIQHGIVFRDLAITGDHQVQRSVVVERIENGSTAAKAGLLPGDQIVQLSGLLTTTSLDCERAFLEKQIGDKVVVVIRRGGLEKTIELQLGGAMEVRASSAPIHNPSELIWKKLGVRLGAVDNQLVTLVNSQLRGGMLIERVDPESPAGKAGMQRGDILVGLQKFETLTLDNITWVLNNPETASISQLKFFIIRDGQVRRGMLP
jgi:serine protease Do